MTAPVLSVVVPALNEEENLPDLIRAVVAALEPAGESFELLIVDDGSQDRTWEILRGAHAADPRIRGVSLSRNFGHQVAVSAGLEHARGKAVAILDADLQDPPRVLLDMLALWRGGAQVVYGVRRKRREGALKRACYHAFYRLLSYAADVSIPLDAGDFCLMDRKIVDILNAMPERKRFVRGLRAWIGLKQVGLEYERDARHAGDPKYTLSGLVGLAADGLVSFSMRPLRLAMRLGFVMSALSLAGAAGYLALRLFGIGTWPLGFASLFIGTCFLFGIQFVLLGILGEYVGRIHVEVKGRPLYLVGDRVGFPDDQGA